MGGVIAQRDTDGVLIVAAPGGGSIVLNDGSYARILTWDECDEILTPFDALDPFHYGGPFWSIKREHDGTPLRGMVWRAKRHALYVRDPAIRIIKASEHVGHVPASGVTTTTTSTSIMLFS